VTQVETSLTKHAARINTICQLNEDTIVSGDLNGVIMVWKLNRAGLLQQLQLGSVTTVSNQSALPRNSNNLNRNSNSTNKKRNEILISDDMTSENASYSQQSNVSAFDTKTK